MLCTIHIGHDQCDVEWLTREFWIHNQTYVRTCVRVIGVRHSIIPGDSHDYIERRKNKQTRRWLVCLLILPMSETHDKRQRPTTPYTHPPFNTQRLYLTRRLDCSILLSLDVKRWLNDSTASWTTRYAASHVIGYLRSCTDCTTDSMTAMWNGWVSRGRWRYRPNILYYSSIRLPTATILLLFLTTWPTNM